MAPEGCATPEWLHPLSDAELLPRLQLWTLRELRELAGVGEDRGATYAYDTVVENQRGMFLFGYAMFLAHQRWRAFDPPAFQVVRNDLELPVPLAHGAHEITQIPLPDLGWEWEWPEWRVLMAGEVDEHGWCYLAVRFQSKHWSGRYRLGRFVRRRIWTRLRVRHGLGCDTRNLSAVLRVSSARKRDRWLGLVTRVRRKHVATHGAIAMSDNDDASEVASLASSQMSILLLSPQPLSPLPETLPPLLFPELVAHLQLLPLDRMRTQVLVQQLASIDDSRLAAVSQVPALQELLGTYTYDLLRNTLPPLLQDATRHLANRALVEELLENVLLLTSPDA